MALNTIDPAGLRRLLKRRRKLKRRQRRWERAVRFNLYARPIADVVGRIFGR